MNAFKYVALYLRKSRFDDESETREEVLARHEKLLTDYCKRNNLIIKKIYREVVSGENIENRPQVQLLLEEVANGLYDGVVVIEIERLSRGNPIDQVEILETFKEAKAKIYTLQKVYDFSNDNDIDEEYFEFGLFMSRREYKTIKRRLMRGKKQAQQEGYYVSPNLPFGFDKKRIGKGFVLVPNEQAEVVKILYNKYVYEDYKTSDLQDYLFQNKIKSNFGRDTWSLSTIRTLLKNKTYLGYIAIGSARSRANTTWVEGKHDPIIDIEVYEKAQLKMKALDTRNNRDMSLKNPLSSILICATCGYTMVRKISSGKAFAFCNTRHCTNSGTYLIDIEKAVINELKKELKGFNHFLENYGDEIERKKETRQKEIELINNEIIKKEKMLTNCCEFLEEGIYTKEKYLQRVNALESELASLKNNLTEIEKEKNNVDTKENIKNAIPVLEKVINEYWNLEVTEKNKLLKSIIEKIEYKKDQPQESWATKNNIKNKFELKIYMKI